MKSIILVLFLIFNIALCSKVLDNSEVNIFGIKFKNISIALGKEINYNLPLNAMFLDLGFKEEVSRKSYKYPLEFNLYTKQISYGFIANLGLKINFLDLSDNNSQASKKLRFRCYNLKIMLLKRNQLLNSQHFFYDLGLGLFFEQSKFRINKKNANISIIDLHKSYYNQGMFINVKQGILFSQDWDFLLSLKTVYQFENKLDFGYQVYKSEVLYNEFFIEILYKF